MKKKHGHYCKVCGEYKANEKFSGRGHAAHICKACASLPPEKKAEMMTVNRLLNLPWRMFKEERARLRHRIQDRRPGGGGRGGRPAWGTCLSGVTRLRACGAMTPTP